MLKNKRIVWLAVCICLLLALAVTVTAADVQETGTLADGIYYTMYTDGTLVIEGTGVIPTDSDDKLPRSGIKTLEIRDGITGVADNAFGYLSELKTLIIAGSVERIGNYAFEMCRVLDLRLGEGIKEIGQCAFRQNNEIQQIVIPSSMESIEGSAFTECTALEKVVFLGGPLSISENAFENSMADTTVTFYYPGNGSWKTEDLVFTGWDTNWVPYTLDAAGNRVPSGDATYIHRFSKPRSGELGRNGHWRTDTDGVLYISGSGHLYPEYKDAKYWTNITGLVVEPGVERIEWDFEGSRKLTFVELPENMTRIPRFRNCESLTRAVIGEGLTTLHYSSFEECVNLRTVTIPESVTQIEFDVFNGCTSLEKIVLPQNVEFIGERLFKGCTSLQEIEIPQKVQRIPEHTFDGCTALKTVTIPAGVSYIGDGAFYECANLSSIRFTGDAPAHIGEYAFALRVGEISLYYPRDNTTWQGDILNKAYGSTALWTPYTLDDQGKLCLDESKISRVVGVLKRENMGEITCTFYSDGKVVFEGTGALSIHFGSGFFYDMTSVEVGEGITRIDEMIISGNKTAVPVTLAASVTEIAPKAFHGSNISGINLEHVTSIGESAFVSSQLEAVVIGDNCAEIPEYAFSSCKQLTSVVVGKNVQTIGEFAFGYCEKLAQFTFREGCGKKFGVCVFYDTVITELVLPDGKTEFAYNELGETTFGGCKELKSIVLPEGLEEIPYRGFMSTEKLESVYFPDSLKIIGEEAFSTLKNLKTVRWGKNLEVIGQEAFYGCESLVEIAFPSNVRQIGVFAFEYCVNLEKVTLNEGLLYISDGAFYKCAIREIVIPSTVLELGYGDYDDDTSSGHGPFEGCSKLERVTFLGDKIAYIPYACFYGTALKEVAIPSGVREICCFAFQDCHTLEKVTLPEGLLYIGDGAFAGCGFEEVTIPSTVLDMGCDFGFPGGDWGTGAFAFCGALQKVTILSEQLQSIPTGCFANTALWQIVIPGSVTEIRSNALSIPDLSTVIFEGAAPTVMQGACSCSGPFIYYPEAYAETYDTMFFAMFNHSGSSTYTVDADGSYIVDVSFTENDAVSKMETIKKLYPEGYSLDQYSVSRLGKGDLVGYGSQAFAYLASNAIFGNLPASVDTDVRFDRIKVGDILRLDGDTRAVVVTEKLADSVVVAQGDWKGTAAYARRTVSVGGSVHWGEVLTREQVEAADYCITRYDGKILSDTSAVTQQEPQWPTLPANPSEEEVQQFLYSLESSYPEGFPYSTDIRYNTTADMSNMMIGNIGQGCSAFAFRVSDTAFGDAPMREVTDIVFENIMVGDILHYDPDPNDASTHVVVVLEVYKDCLVTVEANYNEAMHWGNVFTKKQVEAMMGVYTRYPEGTVPGERLEYQGENNNQNVIGGIYPVNKADPYVGTEYSVFDGETGLELSYGYEVPENGATLLVFFSAHCGYSQNFFDNLDDQLWLSNPYLDVVAIENVARSTAGIWEFRNNYTPKAGDAIRYCYDPDGSMQWNYLSLYQDIYQGMTWPMVIVVTESNGVKIVRTGANAAVSIDGLYEALCEYSAGFAAYEKGEKPAAHTHQYSFTRKVEPTCTEWGYTEYGCACGDRYGDELVAACGHAWDTDHCDKLKICTVCGEEKEAGEHYWLEATCFAPRHCGWCSATEGEALEHILDEGVIILQPTEQFEGQIMYTCARCYQTFIEDIPVIEHIHAYEPLVTTDPTCWENGYTKYVCRCGDSYQVDGAPALTHSWYSATCTAPKTCAFCGTTEGAALGHAWMDATCTASKTCSRCGVTEGSTLSHTWQAATCEKAKTCSVCGATEGTTLGHSWVAATCTKAKTCSACGKTEGTPIAHSYDKGKCTVCGAVDENYKPAYKLGDVNGDGKINVTDAMVALRYAVKKITANDLIVEAADVNSDGKVNVTDAMQILRYAVKKITEFKPAK